MIRSALIAVALIGATWAVYAPALRFDFVTWDDPEYVTANVHVRAGLTLDGIRWAFTTGDRENWHPPVALSHMLDCSVYGLDAHGHHLTNILLHVCNVLLLFGVLRAMTGMTWPSAWVAGLFAVHPLNVEPVVWVSARKDVLSTWFGLLAVAAYVGYARRGGIGRYLLVTVLLAFSLMAKPMLVTLPLLFLLLDYWPLARVGTRHAIWRSRLLEKLPMLVLSVAASLVTVAVRWHAAEQLSIDQVVPFDQRAANALVSYVRYLAKAFWPVDLAVFYPHPNLPGGHPWTAEQLLGAGLLLLAISAAVVRAHRQRWLVVGWLWYLIALLPVIGLVHVSAHAMADRYAYVPLIGIFIAVAWTVSDLTRRADQHRAWPGVGVATAAGLVLVASAVLARQQVRTWRDSATLYQHALEVAPGSAIMASNLANVFAQQEQVEQAIAYYRLALAVDDRYLPAQCNLANLLVRNGRANEAVEHYRRAVELAPNLPPMHINLADALLVLGQVSEAIAQYQQALALDPNHLGVQRTRQQLAYALRLRAQRAADASPSN